MNNTRSPPPPKPPRQPLNSSKTSSAQENHQAVIEANEYKPKNATLPRKTDYRNR